MYCIIILYYYCDNVVVYVMVYLVFCLPGSVFSILVNTPLLCLVTCTLACLADLICALVPLRLELVW